MREKHGEHIIDKASFRSEVEKVYKKFGDEIVIHFSEMIPEQKKRDFDQLKRDSKDSSQVLAFFMDNIDGFELKIVQFLIDFRKKYLAL